MIGARHGNEATPRTTAGAARSCHRAALALALAGAVAVLLNACAVVEPPQGGPEDLIRPHLVAMRPDSGTTGLGEVTVLDLTFSEKMDRVSAASWLHFFPDQRIRRTKWHGATRAEVTLEAPLPPDTVIVVEIAAGMKDAHRVANRTGRRYPIATADSLPGGRITGVLVMADSAVSNGVVEMFAVPPDSLEYFQQPLLRRTVTDRTGAYVFDWLPTPGGPWLLRAFSDGDGNLRAGDREAQRLLPDTLRLAVDRTSVVAGVTTLYAPDTPGRLQVAPFGPAPFPGPLVAWTMKIGDEDTGWVPVPTDKANFAWLSAESPSPVAEVAAGSNRLVVFVDVDGDSTFSGVAPGLLAVSLDTLAVGAADSAATLVLEPWQMVEGIEVEPGLESALEIPVRTWSLTPWTPPPAPDRPDSSLATVAPDTLVPAPAEPE